jgi:hypothetical protein
MAKKIEANPTPLIMMSNKFKQSKRNEKRARNSLTRYCHDIINQLTVIHLSCFTLRDSLAGKTYRDPMGEIDTILNAVTEATALLEQFSFTLNKTSYLSEAKNIQHPPRTSTVNNVYHLSTRLTPRR